MVVELSSQHFVLRHNDKSLNITKPGFTLVFFKMDGCKGCRAFEPIIFQLSRQEKRVDYAVVNLSHNRDITLMSRNTRTPIRKVPFIIFYAEGQPVKVFTEKKKNLPVLRNFVLRTLGELQARSSQSFVSQPRSGSYPQQTQPPSHHAKVYAPEGNDSFQQQRGTGAGFVDMDEEEENNLASPTSIIPHNIPWDSKNRM